MGKAIPLVIVGSDSNSNKNGSAEFKINKEAKKVFQSIRGKVAVIAIAGIYRSGKSFILNRLLRQQSGFEVGPTVDPCTKGIYMWNEPIRCTTSTNEEINVVLIDTEGIGSIQESQTHDLKIFSLALLLSSYFIYNSMGVIDEGAIDKLSLVTNVTKFIHVTSNKQSRTSFSSYFPKFLWILRDFSLQLVDQSGAISPKQYLEKALLQTGKDDSKKAIRETIVECFPVRDCVVLPRPLVEEAKLQNIDKVKYETLRPEFRDKMEAMEKKIFAELEPKKIHGTGVTGESLWELLTEYVEAMNSGKVPVIESSWKAVVAKQNGAAMKAAYEEYKKLHETLIPKLPMDHNDILQKCVEFKKQSIVHLKQHSIEEDIDQYVSQLENLIDADQKNLLLSNSQQSQTSCKQLLEQLFHSIENKLKSEQYQSLPSLITDIGDMRDKYDRDAKGPAKESTAREFERYRVSQAQTVIATQVETRARKVLDEEKQKNVDLQLKLKTVENERLQKESKLKDDLRFRDSQIEDQKRQIGDLNQLIIELHRQINELQKEKKNQVEQDQSAICSLTQQLNAANESVSTAMKEKTALETTINSQRSKLAETEQAREAKSQQLAEFLLEKAQLDDQLLHEHEEKEKLKKEVANMKHELLSKSEQKLQSQCDQLKTQPQLQARPNNSMDQKETGDQDLTLKKKRKLDKQEQKEEEKPQSATNDIDSNELTISQLKDLLRDMGERLPVQKASKKEYVELYNKAKLRRGKS